MQKPKENVFQEEGGANAKPRIENLVHTACGPNAVPLTHSLYIVCVTSTLAWQSPRGTISFNFAPSRRQLVCLPGAQPITIVRQHNSYHVRQNLKYWVAHYRKSWLIHEFYLFLIYEVRSRAGGEFSVAEGAWFPFPFLKGDDSSSAETEWGTLGVAETR